MTTRGEYITLHGDDSTTEHCIVSEIVLAEDERADSWRDSGFWQWFADHFEGEQ